MVGLNGNWILKDLKDGKEYPAVVPSVDYVELMSAGAIDDPFKGVNEKDSLWVAERDWSWRRTFRADAELLAADRVFLVCEMLDTLATVRINGEIAAYADNCHIRHEFEVKRFLKEGENTIEIVFSSPVNYITEQRNATGRAPANPNGLNGIDRIRKPQCHFGWDWGPVLPPSGIAGDISLQPVYGAYITEFAIDERRDGDAFAVRMSLVADTVNAKCAPEAEFSLTAPDGTVQRTTVGVKGNRAECEFRVENPELWWPNGMTERKEQPLYGCDASLTEGGKTLSTKHKNIGLRTIELDRGADEYGSNFRFVVNGKPVFARGANIIPFDSFDTRTDGEKLEYYVRAAAECNFNMFRIWGGGYYAGEKLLDLCDRFGIMVWQDFMFACMAYPFDEPNYLANVQKEVFFNVKRMRERACLAIWCGNNEIEAMANLWAPYPSRLKWNEEFFYRILPKWVGALDAVTPYIPGSPCGTGHLKGMQSDEVGDTHLWAVWHGLQPLDYYRKRGTRFCSEFGFESLPDEKTLAYYAKPEDMRLDSEVFNAHQKCASGNKKMVYYIASRFDLPGKIEDWVYLSQICQSECVRDATEFWRSNPVRCNGSLFWQFNDCWPVCSWAGIDYFGNYKCLQYRAKSFFAPLAVMLSASKESARVRMVNDGAEAVRGTLTVTVARFDGEKVVEKALELECESGFNKEVWSIPAEQVGGVGALKNLYVAAVFEGGGKRVKSTALFVKENKVKLPRANVSAEVTEVGDGVARITVKSDKYARFVRLWTPLVTSPFSDNFFDLLPGESVGVSIYIGNADPEEFKRTLAVHHLAQTEKAVPRLVQNMRRLGIFLIPVNFFSYLYYGAAGIQRKKKRNAK